MNLINERINRTIINACMGVCVCACGDDEGLISLIRRSLSLATYLFIVFGWFLCGFVFD